MALTYSTRPFCVQEQRSMYSCRREKYWWFQPRYQSPALTLILCFMALSAPALSRASPFMPQQQQQASSLSSELNSRPSQTNGGWTAAAASPLRSSSAHMPVHYPLTRDELKMSVERLLEALLRQHAVAEVMAATSLTDLAQAAGMARASSASNTADAEANPASKSSFPLTTGRTVAASSKQPDGESNNRQQSADAAATFQQQRLSWPLSSSDNDDVGDELDSAVVVSKNNHQLHNYGDERKPQAAKRILGIELPGMAIGGDSSVNPQPQTQLSVSNMDLTKLRGLMNRLRGQGK